MDMWLGVELRHLSALAAVAHERSFRGAADRLGYVQSAVSQRIAQLEAAVGVRLVERTRGHRHVDLTEAGRVLLSHAEQIQAELNAARGELRALGDDAEGMAIRVGVFGSLGARLLPQALGRLARLAPDVVGQAQESQSDRELLAAVRDGTLNAACAELPLEPGPFEWHKLLSEPLVLVAATDSPLARRDTPPTLAEMAAEPFVADVASRMFKLVEAEFAAAGQRIDARLGASSDATIQALVGAGLGVAIMPRLAYDAEDAATVALDLGGVLPARTLVCYWASTRRRGHALEAFLAAMDAVCAPLRSPRPPRV